MASARKTVFHRRTLTTKPHVLGAFKIPAAVLSGPLPVSVWLTLKRLYVHRELVRVQHGQSCIHPGNEGTAALRSICPRTAQAHLKRLVATGYLERVHQGGRGRRRNVGEAPESKARGLATVFAFTPQGETCARTGWSPPELREHSLLQDRRRGKRKKIAGLPSHLHGNNAYPNTPPTLQEGLNYRGPASSTGSGPSGAESVRPTQTAHQERATVKRVGAVLGRSDKHWLNPGSPARAATSTPAGEGGGGSAWAARVLAEAAQNAPQAPNALQRHLAPAPWEKHILGLGRASGGGGQ